MSKPIETVTNRDEPLKTSLTAKVVIHIISWSVLYVSVSMIAMTYFGISFSSNYENQTKLAESVAKQKVDQLTVSDKIVVVDVETSFTEPNEVRLLFTYDSAPSRLFHYEWESIADKIDVNLAVKQLPIMSSRFMTDKVLKAHAISEQIDFTDKLDKAMYHMIIEENKTLNTLGQLHDWFLKEGVNNHKLINYLSNTKTGTLFKQYQEIKPKQTPSILVGGSKIIYFDHDVETDELINVINAVAKQVVAENRL